MRRIPSFLLLYGWSEGILRLLLEDDGKFFMTELIIEGQPLRMMVDTGSISYHLMPRDYAAHKGLNDKVKSAMQKQSLKLKNYGFLQVYMVRVNGSVVFPSSGLSLEMEVGASVLQTTRTGEEVNPDYTPSLLGLGFPRKPSGSYLKQLIAHGVIQHEYFTVTVDNFGKGEAVVGELKPQDAHEKGELIYLPIFIDPSYGKKWHMYVSKIRCDFSPGGYFDVMVKAPVLFDTGGPGINGPKDSIDYLLKVIFFAANKISGKAITTWTSESGFHISRDDVKYLPKLHVYFDLKKGKAMSLTIEPHQYINHVTSPSVNIRHVYMKADEFWSLGMPLFRGRSIRFDATEEKVGLVLN